MCCHFLRISLLVYFLLNGCSQLRNGIVLILDDLLLTDEE
jgi:hypothetical protein